MSKLRRTLMYVPGNSPSKLQTAHIYGADTVIFDLEDAVSITEKDSARILVRNIIKELDFDVEIAVRINHISTPFGHDDLECILAAKPDLIRLPKAEYAEDIIEVADIIEKAEIKYGFPKNSIKMMASIESAEGLLNAREIAKAHPRMVAIALGGEDFVADLNTTRSKEGIELLFARSQVLMAARAAKIQAIDSVFSDVRDDEGFQKEVRLIKQLGFDGKSIVHPNQIQLLHKIFSPTVAEVEKAHKVLAAYQVALENKSGVIAIDGKMIDGPIVTRAEKTIAYAQAVGMTGGEANE